MMKRTTIYLPDDIHKELKQQALNEDISMAEIIRRMSEFYLSQNQVFWNSVDELRERNKDKFPEEVDMNVMNAVYELRGKRHHITPLT